MPSTEPPVASCADPSVMTEGGWAGLGVRGALGVLGGWGLLEALGLGAESKVVTRVGAHRARGFLRALRDCGVLTAAGVLVAMGVLVAVEVLVAVAWLARLLFFLPTFFRSLDFLHLDGRGGSLALRCRCRALERRGAGVGLSGPAGIARLFVVCKSREQQHSKSANLENLESQIGKKIIGVFGKTPI